MSEGLQFDAVTIEKEGTRLLSVSTRIAPGAVLTLMGPSGSGKSTLLSLVMGDLAPAFTTSGRVLLNGRDLTGRPPQARRIGILYQDPLLFPHLSVGENLAFGLPRGQSHSARREQVKMALEDIDLAGFDQRDPATLSGGQAARVALMRTLLARPEALLLDEPFSKLDTGLRDQMRRLVFDRARAAGVPVLLVTHDDADAAAAGGAVIRL